MPANFDKCVKDGGKVRTVDKKKFQYKICIINNKINIGHIKKK